MQIFWEHNSSKGRNASQISTPNQAATSFFDDKSSHVTRTYLHLAMCGTAISRVSNLRIDDPLVKILPPVEDVFAD